MKKLKTAAGSPRQTVPVVIKSGAAGNVVSVIAIVALLAGGTWWVKKELASEDPPAPVAAAPEVKTSPAPVAKTPVAAPKTHADDDLDSPDAAFDIGRPAVATTTESAVKIPDAGEPPETARRPEVLSKLDEKAKPLPLVGIDATTRDAVAYDKALILEVSAEGAWDEYRMHLERSLAEAWKKFPSAGSGRNRFDAIWKQPAFYQAFLRWRVLGLMPSTLITNDGHEGGMFFSWLMERDEVMEEILLTVKPSDDDLPKVAKLLFDAWYVTGEEQREKYINLAIACAVVFDRELKIQAPTQKDEYSGSTTIDPLARYRWYIEKNEKGKLTAPVHHSSARDLVWVVCAPVSNDELDWAIDKMHLSRGKWGNAYGMIEYLMERAVNGLNPYEEYTFAEILKEGGICGDQSYFCVNTARAHGIPAMVLSGETDLGGHAWAGVKVKADEWSTMVGRIGGASNGEAGNPQTGGRLSEQEVWLWNERAQQSRLVTVAVFRHLWLADLLEAIGEKETAEDAIRLATNAGRAFSETWARLHDLLVEKTKAAEDPGADEIVKDWIAFVSEMRGQFKENPRMAALAAKAESEFIFPHGKEEDARRALLRERRRIERNSGEQKDLIADSLKREADLLFKNGEGGTEALDKISRLYDRALRDYGGSITGFKTMAEDYFAYMKGDPKQARKAARDIELAFLRVVETGSKEWFRANTETSIYKMICTYYRTAGDEKKAAQLERRYQRLLRAAERGAL